LGKVRTTGVKRVAVKILDAYPNLFTSDFEKNKAIVRDNKVATFPSKRLRNRIIGYITHILRLKAINEGMMELAPESVNDEPHPEE